MRITTALATCSLLLFGCGTGDVTGFGGSSSAGGNGGSSETSMGGTNANGGSSANGGASANGGGNANGGGGGNASGGGANGGDNGVPDPNVDGPYTYKEIDAQTKNQTTGDSLAIHCAYPTAGPTSGPYPVIIVAHGFDLPVTQYKTYVERLASFGYVALTVDFPTSFFSPNNVDSAKDLLSGVDWAGSAATLGGAADASKVGMTGHSLGGQLALLAATIDPRVKASITLDPVDGSMGCSATDCPDVSSLMPIPIPTGFLGETIDSSGGMFGMSCAPAADNFATFYARTTTPSLEVTVVGANHMSFLDNVASCGTVCSFCNAATATNADVNALAKAYVVAFYERYLRGNSAYDTYLTGAIAKARYVTPGKATIDSR